MNITVYLSSKTDISNSFSKAVQEVAEGIGSHRHTLIYGGSNAGQMHRLAAAAKAAGAAVTGIIPAVFSHLADPAADNMIFTKDLSERKAKLYEMGDVFVALPGGIGTLDEVMSTLAEMTVSRDFSKKIILVNIDGIFDPLMEQLEKFAECNLADRRALETVVAVSTAQECIKLINHINFQCYDKEK